jgi:hypothetical protein
MRRLLAVFISLGPALKEGRGEEDEGCEVEEVV